MHFNSSNYWMFTFDKVPVEPTNSLVQNLNCIYERPKSWNVDCDYFIPVKDAFSAIEDLQFKL